jgi:hypothetical protein
MEYHIDLRSARIVTPPPSPVEDGATIVHALGADELPPKFAAAVREPAQAFLHAQTLMASQPGHALYDVVLPTVVPVRPQDRADIPTSEMPAVVTDDTQEVSLDDDSVEQAQRALAERHAEYVAFCQARQAAIANPPSDPLRSPLVYYAVQQLADSGHLGAQDLLGRSPAPTSVGMIAARAAALWPPLVPLVNRIPF